MVTIIWEDLDAENGHHKRGDIIQIKDIGSRCIKCVTRSAYITGEGCHLVKCI